MINEHHFAVLRVEVKAPLTEGQFLGSVVIETPHERVTISAKLRTVEGCLGVKPEHVILRPAFPVCLVTSLSPSWFCLLRKLCTLYFLRC